MDDASQRVKWGPGLLTARSVRALVAMFDGRFPTAKQTSSLRPYDFIRIKGVGRYVVRDVERALEDVGLHLRENPPFDEAAHRERVRRRAAERLLLQRAAPEMLAMLRRVVALKESPNIGRIEVRDKLEQIIDDANVLLAPLPKEGA